jgi:hypothetical protein
MMTAAVVAVIFKTITSAVPQHNAVCVCVHGTAVVVAVIFMPITCAVPLHYAVCVYMALLYIVVAVIFMTVITVWGYMPFL